MSNSRARRRARISREQARPARRRAWYVARVEAATDPAHRVSAAADYLRTQLAEADEAEAARVADAAVGYLLRAGDAIPMRRYLQ